MIFVNFKTYPQASEHKAVKLAQICQEVAKISKVPIIPCVQTADLYQVSAAVGPVWVQHLDPVESGKNTGYVTAQAVKNHGGSGTLLNHSEHPIKFEDLKKAILLAKQFGLKTMVLVSNLNQVKEVDQLHPDYLGLEEPSLIGGKVAMVKSEQFRSEIKGFVKLVKNAVPLIGAGINEPSDIKESLALGAKGVLVASAVVISENPKEILQAMAKAFML